MRKIRFAVAGATIVGIALRGFGLGRSGLWTDEAYTAFLASLPFSKLMSELRADCQAPLYYMLQSLVGAGDGASETRVRFLACLAGIATIPLIYLLGKRLISDRAGLWAAWLLALSPMHVHYSREARNYSWLTLMAVLALLAAAALHRRPSVGTIIATSATVLALGHLHNLGLAYAAGIVAGPSLQAVVARDRSRLLAWACVAGIVLVGFLPWATVIMDQNSRMDIVFAWMKPNWDTDFPWQPVLSLAALSPGALPPIRNGIGHVLPTAWVGLLLAALLSACALGSSKSWATPRSTAWLMLAVLVPLGAIFGYSCLRAPIYVIGRVDSPLLPFLILILAAGIASLPRLWVVASAASMLLLVAYPLTLELGTDFRSQERNIARYLSGRMSSADRLVVTGIYKPSFEYYLGAARPDVEIRVFPPERDLHPGWIDWSAYSEDRLASVASDLANAESGRGGRVWVVQTLEPTKVPLTAALSRRFGSPEAINTNYLGIEIQAYPAR